MANATINAPTTTQIGDFNATVTFEDPVTDFGESKVSIVAVSGNGITGVVFEVFGQGTTYNLPFTLPEDVKGSLKISITGQVTPEGSSTAEAVTANSPIVAYNNITNVTATFGTVEYRENGVIAVPITFAEAVIAPAKSICEITRVSGDALQGIDYRLVGKGTDYELVFEVPPDRAGRFSIAVVGYVFKTASRIWDNVIATPLTVPYNTSVPQLKTFDIPADYTPGERFDVILEYDADCTLNNPVAHFDDDDATYLDFCIFEGADLGVPNFYRKTDNTFPTLPLPADLGTDWTQDDLQTVEATIYLLRWDAVSLSAVGIFNMTIKPGFVRGPTGS